jgi:hypothetical protein
MMLEQCLKRVLKIGWKEWKTIVPPPLAVKDLRIFFATGLLREQRS